MEGKWIIILTGGRESATEKIGAHRADRDNRLTIDSAANLHQNDGLSHQLEAETS